MTAGVCSIAGKITQKCTDRFQGNFQETSLAGRGRDDYILVTLGLLGGVQVISG